MLYSTCHGDVEVFLKLNWMLVIKMSVLTNFTSQTGIGRNKQAKKKQANRQTNKHSQLKG